MPVPISEELRERIIREYKEGKLSQAKVAKQYRVSKDFVYKLLKHDPETGSVRPKPMGGWVKPK